MMFLETISIYQGEIQNRQAHEERMQQTASHFGFKAPSLRELRELLLQEQLQAKVKCRVVYHRSIQEISFENYIPRQIRSLKIIEASVDYSFKFADREIFKTLSLLRGECDEILISRNGFITDTSFSNVVLSRGKNYFTPANPLLNGTKRQKLLREGIISQTIIHRDDLSSFDRIHLINALLDLEEGISLPVSSIIP